MPSLTAWLIVGVLLLVCGLLAALANRRPAGLATAAVLALAGAVLSLAALIRFAVLTAAAGGVLLLVLVLGAVLLLIGALLAATEDSP